MVWGGFVSTVVVFHKTLGRGLCLINQNAKKGNQETRGMLFFRQEHIQREKKDRGWTREFTVVGHA